MANIAALLLVTTTQIWEPLHIVLGGLEYGLKTMAVNTQF